ncbi:MAG: redoxin domain-containing protein, partial [Dongiaceae bacterium]
MTYFILSYLAGLRAIARRVVRGNGLRGILGTALVAGAAIIWLGLDGGPLTRWSSIGTTPAYAAADPASSAPLFGAQQWLNTRPLHPEDIRGKVVLVNFWTYSCINCLRVLPHVRAWAEKYKDRGLVVIGVHTPEFAFEKDVANVAKATVALGIGYPVAIDNDFGIWRAFDNNAWPALYFIGADGRIRHQMLGEGDYDQSERLIQHLLSEADGTPVAGDIAPVTGKGPEAAPDMGDLRSGETYIGYAEGSDFASPGGVDEDVPSLYRSVPALPLNQWSLAGTWTIGSEFATLNDTS